MVVVASPRINNGKVLDQHWSLECAFGDGHKLDRAFTFTDGVLLISQGSINHPERAESRCIVGLVAHLLFKFFPRTGKGGTGCGIIAAEPRSKTFAPSVRKRNVFFITPTNRHN